MTKNRSRQISAQEWIQDYFCPAVSVLGSPDAEAVCAKNNLSPAELLQPFSKLPSDVTVRDPEGVTHPVGALAVAFQDFKKDPSRLVNQKLLSDLVADCTEEATVTREYGDSCGRRWEVKAPAFTPWYDLWMKLYAGSVPATEHEYCRHHVACVMAASSASKDPLGDLRALEERRQRHQQDKPNSYPQFALPPHSVLRYHLLLHDAYEATDARAQEVLAQMRATFGAAYCHLLQINSRKVEEDNPTLVEHWLGRGHRFCNVDARREGMGATVITTAETASANANANAKALSKPAPPPPVANTRESHPPSHPLDHPLAMNDEEDESARTPSPPALQAASKQALVPATEANLATHLTSNDIDRIRIFVRDFCIHGLIPYLEQQMRQLNELVTNRKSRSFLSGAKRWFGQNKPGAASGTSVVYSKEATELQMRKLGDFYFMMRLYKNAHSCFQSCKKDFQADEAWNYYAGAMEMAALSQFMQNDVSKKYPSHYMEDSVTKYLQVCQMPEYAVRATLFDALCLKSMGQFQEAAARFLRMTNEQKDLRSSLLFEQASYCHLLTTPTPQVRKYAFHIILAGYRFTKAGQKEHAVRAYRQGFQIYKDRGWRVAEEHILYTLGHQALLMKDYSVAVDLFNQLLSGERPPSNNSLQQMCHLREFFIVHHMREKDASRNASANIGRADASAASSRRDELTVPVFRAQQCLVDLSCREWSGGEIVGLEGAHPGSSWQNLERVICEQMRGQEILFLQRTCQPVFTPVSNNSLAPQAVVGEVIRLLMPVENKFHTSLLLKKVQLVWKFRKDESEEWTESELLSREEQSAVVASTLVSSLSLEKNSTARIVLSLTPAVPGELVITGVEYSMRAQFPQTVDTDYTIKGRQHFSVRGPRLKSTKEHRLSVTYGQDLRLSLQVTPPRPRLELELKMPDSLVQGEIRRTQLVARNKGQVAMEGLYLVHQLPGLFSIGKRQKRAPSASTSLFSFPVVWDPILRETREDGESVTPPLDFLPIPLDRPLEAGAEEKITLWMRAPEQVGRHDVNLYCYYRTAAGRKEGRRELGERIFSGSYVLKVLPSVAASASLGAAEAFGNETYQTLTVHVSGVGKEATGHSGRDLGEVAVTQVGLVSHARRLSKLESAGMRSVQKMDSSTLCVQVEDAARKGDEGDRDLFFSTVQCSSSQDDALVLHTAPHLDFLKQGFLPVSRGQPPLLRHDLVSVSWQAKGAGGDNIRGQLVVPLRSVPDQGRERGRTEEVDGRAGKTRAPASASTALPVKVEVEVSPVLEHDFLVRPACTVPCTVVVTNPTSAGSFSPSEEEVRVRLRAADDDHDDDGAGMVLVGAVCSEEVLLGPGQSRRFHVGVAVTSPGLYQCTGLKVGASSSGGRSTSAPVKITFFARQSPSSSVAAHPAAGAAGPGGAGGGGKQVISAAIM